jgi:glutathione S-transferase
VLSDSQAILVYIANKYAGKAWLPNEPAHMASVIAWLCTAANEVQNGLSVARLVDKFGYQIDKANTPARSARLMATVDTHLASNAWLGMGRPSIAQFFPTKTLPNFIGMPVV